MNRTLIAAGRSIILPCDGLGVEIVILDQDLGLVADADRVIDVGGAEIVIVDVHFAEADAGHTLFAEG